MRRDYICKGELCTRRVAFSITDDGLCYICRDDARDGRNMTRRGPYKGRTAIDRLTIENKENAR